VLAYRGEKPRACWGFYVAAHPITSASGTFVPGIRGMPKVVMRVSSAIRTPTEAAPAADDGRRVEHSRFAFGE
jgi:hypothetical protein